MQDSHPHREGRDDKTRKERNPLPKTRSDTRSELSSPHSTRGIANHILTASLHCYSKAEDLRSLPRGRRATEQTAKKQGSLGRQATTGNEKSKEERGGDRQRRKQTAGHQIKSRSRFFFLFRESLWEREFPLNSDISYKGFNFLYILQCWVCVISIGSFSIHIEIIVILGNIYVEITQTQHCRIDRKLNPL